MISDFNLLSGFPSLHAAWAFMLAVSVYKVFKLNIVLIIGIISALTLSVFRVVAGSHSLLDIGFGALIGTLVTVFIFEALDT